MDTYKVEAESLTQVADAIRAKTGKLGELEFPMGFASAIAAISAGGSIKYEIGEYTPEVDTRTGVILPHGLGVEPTVILVCAKDRTTLAGETGYLVTQANYNFSFNNECHYVVSTSNPSISGSYLPRSGYLSDTTFRISATPSFRLKAGVTYIWVAMVLPVA